MENERTVVVRTRPSTTAMLALIISIAALTLSWIAYNRTGKDLEDSIAEQVNKASQNAQKATDTVEQNLDAGPDGVDDGAQ